MTRRTSPSSHGWNRCPAGTRPHRRRSSRAATHSHAHAAPHTHAYARAETGHDVPHVLQRVPVQDLVLLPLAQTEPVDIRGVLAPFVHLLQLRDEGSEDLQVAAGT